MKTVGGIKLAEITDIALLYGTGVQTANHMIKDGRIEAPATSMAPPEFWTEEQIARMTKKIKNNIKSGKAA